MFPRLYRSQIALFLVNVTAIYGCHQKKFQKNLHPTKIIPIFAAPNSSYTAHENNKHYKPSLNQTK
jgi:hypothetical protein